MDPSERSRPGAGRTGRADRAARPALHWIGEHVRGFHAAVGASLLLGVALVVGAMAVFGAVAGAVALEWTQAFDRAVLGWVGGTGSPLVDTVALEVTALGGAMVAGLVGLVSTAFLWITRHRWSVLFLWTAVVGGVLVNQTLKMIIDRPRPEVFPWRVPHAGAASFPSGHSMTAMVAYAALAYLIARLAPPGPVRWLTAGTAAAVIVLVGASRVYLGVHYPTDVIAGFAAGAGWVAFCALGVAALRYFRGRKPDVEAQERDLDGPPPAPARS
jgi:undecaprenyl-diphosphatase